ncbi:MAG: hypothetical protein FJ207_07945 [Gemmatimonadetes bacterium]|nr:hypothetical protein [Gemmatimonadota bacterium]
MRRPLALLALAVLTWSNATVLRCAASTQDDLGSEAAAAQHAHHGPGQPPARPTSEDASDHHHEGPTSHPAGQDCGVLMACGTALSSPTAAPSPTLPETFDTMRALPLAAPSAVDLSLDPPPPRRLA